MKEIAVEEFNDVNWRQYRAFGRELRKVTPEGTSEENVSFDELKAYMLVAAINGGWVKGITPPDPPITMDSLDDWSAPAVIAASDKVFTFYGGLRTPDPN